MKKYNIVKWTTNDKSWHEWILKNEKVDDALKEITGRSRRKKPRGNQCGKQMKETTGKPVWEADERNHRETSVGSSRKKPQREISGGSRGKKPRGNQCGKQLKETTEKKL
ncbi:MAG: hypothetical protein NC089_06370 [Bacteroides sp.]|nr:hypothetical protein [Bacteroides sp.]MCM1550726.1 hypothetical protein [Clostridium sp.]